MAKISWRRALPLTTIRKAVIILLMVAFLSFGARILWDVLVLRAPAVTAVATGSSGRPGLFLFREELPWREFLFSGIPLLRDFVTPRPVVAVQEIAPPRSFGATLLYFFTNVEAFDPRSYLKAQIPLLSLWPNNPTNFPSRKPPHFPELVPISRFGSGQPVVVIYHTHTSESYIPSSGASHAPGGKRGQIVDVGEALAKFLINEYGINTVHSREIHDYPSFMKAYGPSEITVKNLLQQYPSIQMVFDIHRDAEKRENTTVKINGEDVARISIVVAIGQEDLIQPHWQQNHAFAKVLEAKMNQRYPGLSRGIQLVEWRYNQHLHPRALLLEVGAQENSREEAIRAMRLLASIIAEIFKESDG